MGSRTAAVTTTSRFARMSMTVGTLVTIAFAVTACTGGGPVEQQTAPPVTGVATGGASASASASASTDPAVQAARQKFDAANQALAAANASATDVDIVGALVTAGFDKQAMQITPDTTTIGRKADSIEVSVLVGQTCLLGEFRDATYVGETSPVLSTGHCLIGSTRAINF